MRYACEEPGFEGAFLEFSERGWTRAHMAMLVAWQTDAPEWWELVRSHVTAMHIPAVEGLALTAPEHLTEADLERIEFVHYRWFWAAVGKLTRDLVDLGEAARRRLWPTPEATAENSQTQS